MPRRFAGDRLVIASHNPGKVREIGELLRPFAVTCISAGSLGLPEPEYYHHGLIRDESGRRLAKRDESETLRSLRERGERPDALRRRLGFEF